MTNLLLNDPAAIHFSTSVESVRIFSRHAKDFASLVRSSDSTRETDEGIDRLARQIAVEAQLTASSETILAISYLFVKHFAEMAVMTSDEEFDF